MQAGPTPARPGARLGQLRRWLADVLGEQPSALEPISGDASFRRYFRIRHADRTLVVMDAPPSREPPAAFVRVAGLLRAAGVHVPEIVHADVRRGFLVLSDLGSRSYLDVLDDANAESLFGDAVRTLLRWQLAVRPGAVPDYDRTRLQAELDLFPEWYVGRHLGRRLAGGGLSTWRRTCDDLLSSALGQPRVFVHRDYMPRNLLLSDPNPGVIDFQDALAGPITYDLVSLYRDAFVSWDEDRVREWALQYREQAARQRLPVPPQGDFLRAFDWMGMQRHLKVLGIFARLCHRDGKAAYIADAPRFLGYLRAVAGRYDCFASFLCLLDELEQAPPETRS